MSITNRNLVAGTKLAARYKGREYAAEVVQREDGTRYRLKDGREFKSPSSAGSAVMGGNRPATAGGSGAWRTGKRSRPGPASAERKGRTKNAPRAFERLEDGSCFCSACGEAFEVADDRAPAECPRGHRADGLEAAAV